MTQASRIAHVYTPEGRQALVGAGHISPNDARYVAGLETELVRLRRALQRIAEKCGDDSEPEDNPVQIARGALR